MAEKRTASLGTKAERDWLQGNKSTVTKKTANDFPATKAEREWLRAELDRRQRRRQRVTSPTYVEKQAAKK